MNPSKKMRLDDFIAKKPQDNQDENNGTVQTTPSDEDELTHKVKYGEMLMKYIGGPIYTDSERDSIVSIVESNAKAYVGFATILQLTKSKLQELHQRLQEKENALSNQSKQITFLQSRIQELSTPPTSSGIKEPTPTATPVPPPTFETKLPLDKTGIICTIADLSFAKPRKKLDLELYPQSIRLKVGKDDSTEVQLSQSDIKRVICVPSPQKEKKQWTFLIFYKSSQKEDVIVFSFLDQSKLKLEPSKPKELSLGNDDSSKSIFTQISEKILKHKVIEPSSSLFQSSKKEQYVDCYLKTKDGQLFFLEDGLLFGMKSPFIYIPFNDIASVQFVTITTRTFDLNVSLAGSSEHTFGMIDEGNLTAVTAFVKRFKLDADKKAREKLPSSPSKPKLAPVPVSQPATNGTAQTHKEQNGTANSRPKRDTKAASSTAPMQIDEGSSDEEDDNFNPQADSDVPEEFDSEEESGQEGSGSEEESGSESEANEKDEESESESGSSSEESEKKQVDEFTTTFY